MLRSIRKFSSSIYAKIFLVVIAIPFVFWGMGPIFSGGKLNTIVEIGNEKIPTQEFVNYITHNAPDPNFETLDKNLIEKLLSNFIGEKLVAQEIEYYDIKLSENSLSKLIKNEELFKKDNKFSRTEYEKFLVKNSLSAVKFEASMTEKAKKNQLFDFIGSGIVPSEFMIDVEYDKINQKRNIDIINLNDFFESKFNFSQDQIDLSFNENKDAYKEIYKSIKYIKLSPKNLTGNEDVNDVFFQKIDEIDDLIVEGNNLDFVSNNFNLPSPSSTTFSKSGKGKNLELNINLPEKIVKNVFNIEKNEPTILLKNENDYFLIELTATESLQRKISDKSVKNDIISKLKIKTKRKLISQIIDRINNNDFKKTDFDKFSVDKKISIKKIKIENLNDDKLLKKELINQIYGFSEKRVVVVADIFLSESYLIYIDKVENASISKNSDEYKKYFSLAKAAIANNLFNTYNSYLQNKYEININYKALDNIKNYF